MTDTSDIIHALYGDREGAFTVDMRKVRRVRRLIAQEANKARLDEAKWWSAKTVWLLKAAMDNNPAFDSHNKEMADRIAQLGGKDA